MSNYVNNEELYNEIVEYREKYLIYKEEKRNGNEVKRPSLSPALGKMIAEISEGLAKKGNFSGYTWKDDMIQDGCLACILYLHNYKPNYPNAFGYITSICARAFINHIKKQKKHSLIKDILANADVRSAVHDGTVDYQEIRKLITEDEKNA